MCEYASGVFPRAIPRYLPELPEEGGAGGEAGVWIKFFEAFLRI